VTRRGAVTEMSIPTLRRNRDTEKTPLKVLAPGFEVRGKSPKLSAN
jgi:hypothetical protein